MRQINDKIRNGIANSYYLRGLAKDDKLTQEERDKIYDNVKLLDKKIMFYKNLNNAMREMKDEKNNKSNNRSF
jgi:hypothetical protein